MNYQLDATKAIFDVIEGDIVIINLENGNYYNLSNSGALIWKQLFKTASTEGLVSLIQSSFEIDSAKTDVKKDVADFLEELMGEKLVLETNATAPAIEGSEQGENGEYSPPKLEVFSDMQDFLLVDPIHEVDENGLPKYTPPSFE